MFDIGDRVKVKEGMLGILGGLEGVVVKDQIDESSGVVVVAFDKMLDSEMILAIDSLELVIDDIDLVMEGHFSEPIPVDTDYNTYCESCNDYTDHDGFKFGSSQINYVCSECKGVPSEGLIEAMKTPPSIWYIEGQEHLEMDKRVQSIKDRLTMLSRSNVSIGGIVNDLEEMLCQYETDIARDLGVDTLDTIFRKFVETDDVPEEIDEFDSHIEEMEEMRGL